MSKIREAKEIDLKDLPINMKKCLNEYFFLNILYNLISLKRLNLRKNIFSLSKKIQLENVHIIDRTRRFYYQISNVGKTRFAIYFFKNKKASSRLFLSKNKQITEIFENLLEKFSHLIEEPLKEMLEQCTQINEKTKEIKIKQKKRKNKTPMNKNQEEIYIEGTGYDKTFRIVKK